jgi:RimJ/RimL family protein N-acetyltransferase
MTMLETPRLLLRPWQESDRHPFHQMNADPRVMEFFAAPLSPAESDATIDRIQAHFAQHGFGFFAAELRATGEFIGFAGMSHVPFEAHFTPCVEIGWRLAAAHWNQGLATEGARACLRYAFEELALAEVVAFTVPANRRSRRVMEKLGMSHDPADDFDHPRLPEGHPLRRHVLYRVRPALQSQP